MALYAVSFRTAAAAASALTATAQPVYWSLFPATTGRVRLREVGVINTTATAAAIGLIRTTARGTQTATQVGVAQDAADAAGLANFDTTFSTNPTGTTAAVGLLRRAMVPASIGGGIVWVFGPNEMIAISTNGIALINTTGTGQILDGWAVWDE